jgi:hypothetical protein
MPISVMPAKGREFRKYGLQHGRSAPPPKHLLCRDPFMEADGAPRHTACRQTYRFANLSSQRAVPAVPRIALPGIQQV